MDHILFEDGEQDSKGTDVSAMPPPLCKIPTTDLGKFLLDDSFDAPPKKEVIYKPNEVVRKRDEREKLESRSCPQCDAYYRYTPLLNISLIMVCGLNMIV